MPCGGNKRLTLSPLLDWWYKTKQRAWYPQGKVSVSVVTEVIQLICFDWLRWADLPVWQRPIHLFFSNKRVGSADRSPLADRVAIELDSHHVCLWRMSAAQHSLLLPFPDSNLSVQETQQRANVRVCATERTVPLTLAGRPPSRPSTEIAVLIGAARSATESNTRRQAGGISSSGRWTPGSLAWPSWVQWPAAVNPGS